jgi:hypothetical protein
LKELVETPVDEGGILAGNAYALYDNTYGVSALSVVDGDLIASNWVLTPELLNASRIYRLPNQTGTLALTQQATDYEVTDATKGVIMKSPNGSRWRLTIDDNGVLLRTALTLLFSLAFMCGSQAQVRDLVYTTNNVVIGPTNGNALAVTNSVAFSNPLTFGTNAATTRTNLGVTVASNLPAPYSGAAASNSLLVANGSGSSVFVASRVQSVQTTSDSYRTNTSSATDTNNNETALSVSLESNSVYAFSFYFITTASGTNGFAAWIDSPTNGIITSGAGRGSRPNNTFSDLAFVAAGGRMLATLPAQAGPWTNANFVGTGLLRTSNSCTMVIRWSQNTSGTNVTTLHTNSVLTVEKLYP